jgi:hypothetical protein
MRVAKPVQLSADEDRWLRILSKPKRIEARVQMRAVQSRSGCLE